MQASDDCAICLEPLNNGKETENPGRDSGCPHIFHSDCVDNLIDKAKDPSNIPCPLCKKNLVPPNMRTGDWSYGGKKKHKRPLKTKTKKHKRSLKTKTKKHKTKKRKTRSTRKK